MAWEEARPEHLQSQFKFLQTKDWLKTKTVIKVNRNASDAY